MNIAKPEIESQEGRLIYPDVDFPQALTKWIRWKASQCSGDIIQIGCDSGELAHELAIWCSDKRIWTVEPIFNPEHANYLPNVNHVSVEFKDLDYDQFSGIGFVVLAVNHDPDQLQIQTEKILAFMRTRKSLHPAAVVWHGHNKSELWTTEVLRYLASLSEPVLKLDDFEAAFLDVL